MAVAEKLGDESGHDKVTEKRMAELLGTTPKALQRKRERNIIPAAKMKMRRDHHVPLCTQAVAALIELRNMTGQSRYLFPGIGPKQPVMSENTINHSFAKIGYARKLVGHGTRHTASTLLREHEWIKDHVESQLAHKEDGISGVYNKARYLPQRRHMMQWYADYLEALAEGITKEKADDFAARVNAASR